jgi:integration host factor subunit alpha
MSTKTLTKADLSEYLFSKIGLLSKQNSKKLVDQIFEEICLALENGYEVKLSGFGKFCLREKNERPGRNPRTNEQFPVSARRVVTFKPCQKFKGIIEVFKQAQSE